MPEVKFSVLDREVKTEVPEGTTLLEAASEAGVQINSICGGKGACGKCKVRVLEGDTEVDSLATLKIDEVKAGYTLACQTRIKSDAAIEVPAESTAEKGRILVDEDSRKFSGLISNQGEEAESHEPLVRKHFLDLPEPTLGDNVSDQRRVNRELGRQADLSRVRADLKVRRTSSRKLRENGWRVTATTGWRDGAEEIIELEPSDTTNSHFGLAVDIGTTTLVAHLVDLTTGETIDADARYNSQMQHGEEVTRRIRYAEENGPEGLQEAVIEDINELIYSLATREGLEPKEISSVVCSGNTTMMHLFYGFDASSIRKKPYVPNATEPPPVRASKLGVEINPRGLIYFLPAMGGWVGGDVTAGVLVTGINRSDQLTMLADIGTNGEILVGNENWMISAAASAGPAFEGTGIGSGMKAGEGAIDKVEIANGELIYSVIGNGTPKGICGSGLIDLVASLVEGGYANRSGKLKPDSSERVRKEGGEAKIVLEENARNGNGEEISIYQSEIKNLINAKAAIYSGARALMQSLNLELENLDRLLIAGGFGSYLDREKAKVLGLIPDLPADKIKFVGNTSIKGAKAALLSREAYQESREISESVTYYDLMEYQNYFEEFQAAKFLPHTDLTQFSSVTGKRNGGERDEQQQQ